MSTVVRSMLHLSVAIASWVGAGCSHAPPPLTPAQYGTKHVTDLFVYVPEKQNYYWEVIDDSNGSRHVANQSEGRGDSGMLFGRPRLADEQSHWKRYAPYLKDASDVLTTVIEDGVRTRLGGRGYLDLRTPDTDVGPAIRRGDVDKPGAGSLRVLPSGSPDAEWALYLDIDQLGLVLGGYHVGSVAAAVTPVDGWAALVAGHAYLVDSKSHAVLWYRPIEAWFGIDGDLDDLTSRRATDYPPALVRAARHFASVVAYDFVRGETNMKESAARATVQLPDAPADAEAAQLADLKALQAIAAAAPPKPKPAAHTAKGH